MILIENLHKYYGAVHAVRGINLAVPKGEVFCFLGPNGAGKTTTIKILTGLMRASSGSIRVGGIDVQADPLSAKKIMGYIPDMPFLYERLTVEEVFRFTGDLYDVSPAATESALERYFELFALLEHRDVLVHDLSHGMRQRLIYACTFLHDPAVLFVDEPLIGLDPYTIRLIKDLLREKASGGMTVFLTTHILALAEDIGDRIGIIRDGEMCALGSLAELRERHGGRNLEEVFLGLTRPAAK